MAGPSGSLDATAPVKLLRMIGRLNVGGPAIQAITLTERLRERGYATLLVRGVEGPRESSMDWLAQELGVRPYKLRWMRRELGRHDLLALLRTTELMLRNRPAILHTHAAKAGTMGRLAALILGPWGPAVRVHTFHGHVLTGYFGSRSSRAFLAVERFLARRTSRLVAVSEEVRSDLIRLGVAPPEHISVVPLGFDLDRFLPVRTRSAQERAATRAHFRVPEDRPLVTLVARLVPIKRVDRFLRIAQRLVDRGSPAHFMIVGDGELNDELRRSEVARRLGGRLSWTGMVRDVVPVYEASDLVVLTSDNEGTPVSLIEAQAAGLPVVSTDVGGVRSVVLNGESGHVVSAEDEDGYARCIAGLLEEPARRQAFGRRGSAHVVEHFGLPRLVEDLDRLYRELLGQPPGRIAGSEAG
jgi:glycosyltransferase involved in cell wall biosynthesis